VKWNNLKVVSTSFEKSFILNINYSLDADSDFISLNIILKKNIRRHTARCTPKNAYTKKIPIDELKLKDFLSLCDKDLYRQCIMISTTL